MRGSWQAALAFALIAFGLAGSAPADETVGIRATATPANPTVTVVQPRQVQTVLGREVRSSANENMGRVVDIIVDRAGQVRAAIIDFGGFFGVGSRRIAVDWSALRFSSDGDRGDVVTLELTRDQVKEAPEYRDRQSVVILGAAGSHQALPIDW